MILSSRLDIQKFDTDTDTDTFIESFDTKLDTTFLLETPLYLIEFYENCYFAWLLKVYSAILKGLILTLILEVKKDDTDTDTDTF